MYRRFVSGSNEPPGQLAPPVSAGTCRVASGPSRLLKTGGVKSGPIWYRLMTSERFGPQRRCEVDQVINRDALPIEWGRPGREGLSRAGLFPGYGGLRDRPFFNRPNRLAGFAIEDEQERLLGRLGQGLDAPAVHRDVEEDGRAGKIVIPYAVMDDLVVPFALPGLEVERDEALVEQRVARPVAAVIIARRHFDGQ